MSKNKNIEEKMRNAEALIEALPYISKFHDSYVVIKYGGSAIVDSEIRKSIIKDTILLKFLGMKPVIVHGGGIEISKAMEKLGKKPEFISGLRITDEETLSIVKMVLVGKINSEIVSEINKLGGKSIGLTGEAGIIIAKKKSAKVVVAGMEKEVDLGYVGEVQRVNAEAINIAAEHGYIPVISPIGLSKSGESMNINSDEVAASIAVALKAGKVIFITDVNGVLRDINDDSSLIKELNAGEAKELIEKGIAAGSMIPKLKACINCAQNGIDAHVINGRIKHALLIELFTDTGIGTMVRSNLLRKNLASTSKQE